MAIRPGQRWLHLVLLGTIVLVLFDLYLSHRRIVEYGAIVELNPVASRLAEAFGPWAATAFLSLWNLLLLGAICLFQWNTALHVLFGLRLGLGLMQLRSLQVRSRTSLAACFSNAPFPRC